MERGGSHAGEGRLPFSPWSSVGSGWAGLVQSRSRLCCYSEIRAHSPVLSSRESRSGVGGTECHLPQTLTRSVRGSPGETLRRADVNGQSSAENANFSSAPRARHSLIWALEPRSRSLTQNTCPWGFLSGPVAKTLCSQCRGLVGGTRPHMPQ